MKVFAKYVTVEAVKDKQVLTLLFLDWERARDCLETVKMHGMKPLKSFSVPRVWKWRLRISIPKCSKQSLAQ